ncbi:unnamed protein product, partial [Vitis vinifera]|uniref:Uncharacterized protein n=1 Tax=Vitis vinifera TaxID=29760 RepID=D7T3I5_VITVI
MVATRQFHLAAFSTAPNPLLKPISSQQCAQNQPPATNSPPLGPSPSHNASTNGNEHVCFLDIV